MKRAFVVFLVASAALLLGAVTDRFLRPRYRPDPEVVRVERVLPRAVRVDLQKAGAFAMSPDGRSTIYVVQGTHTTSLMVQYLDKVLPIAIAQTDGARVPFVGAAGTRVGFFSPDGSIRDVDLASGATTSRVAGVALTPGATFAADDTVIFGVRGEGLRRVSGTAAPGTPLTRIDRAHGEREHAWPRWVASLNAVLFTVTFEQGGQQKIALARLDGSGSHRILTAGQAARYLDPGVLVVARGAELWALPYDATSGALGDGHLIVADVAASEEGIAQFDAAGAHVVFAPASSDGDAVAATEDGRTRDLLDDRRPYAQPRLSPDGGALAVTFRDAQRQPVLAMFSMADGASIRQWIEPAVEPRWTADARWVVFARPSDEEGWQLRFASRDGAAAESSGLVLTDIAGAPPGWKLGPSYTTLRGAGQPGIWAVPLTAGPCPAAVEMRGETQARALTITAGGIRHVAVVGREGGDPTALESDSFEPVWSADGEWLFYRQDAELRRRRVRSAAPLSLSPFETVIRSGLVDGACGVPNYDVSIDGRVVVSVRRPLTEEPSRVRFMLNYRPAVK